MDDSSLHDSIYSDKDDSTHHTCNNVYSDKDDSTHHTCDSICSGKDDDIYSSDKGRQKCFQEEIR